jgi:acyl-CoA thioester hydrolase
MNLTEARPFLIELDFEPKTYDIDFAGVVSNIVYIRWLEDLRLAMLRAHMPLDGLMRQGLAPTLASTSIEYKRPLRLFDRVRGSMWSADMTDNRWILAAEFVRVADGKTAASARQVGAVVSLETARSVGIPADVLARWREAMGG